MGLDVLLKKVFKPTAEDLKTRESREAYEWEHDCSLHLVYPDEVKKMDKLRDAGFLLEWDDDQIIDWDATFKAKGYESKDWHEYYICGDDWCFIPEEKFKDQDFIPEEKDELHIKDGELILKTEHVFGFCTSNTDYGYQRKGANANFYQEGKWDDDNIVTTKAELLSDYQRFFSSYFKANIVDKFVEGLMMVCYW